MELDQRLESILKMTAARFQDGNSDIELEAEAERTLESRALVNGRVGRRGNSLQYRNPGNEGSEDSLDSRREYADEFTETRDPVQSNTDSESTRVQSTDSAQSTGADTQPDIRGDAVVATPIRWLRGGGDRSSGRRCCTY